MALFLFQKTVKNQLGILFMTSMLVSQIPFAAQSQTETVSDGKLRIGSQWNLLPLNPFHTNETLSVHMLDLVFNKLVRLNHKGEMEPDLAQSWTVSGDGKTYTFRLREEVYFHDKSPFSSRDVLASYRLFTDRDVASPYAYIFKNVSKVEAPDSRTVVFTLREPFAPFLFELKQFYIVPAGAVDGVPSREKCERFGRHPVGTGPFRFLRWEGEGKYVLARYSLYHEVPAKLKEISLQAYPSVEETWAALMRGEADMMLYLNRNDFEVVKKDPTFDTFSVPSSPFYYALAYNHRKPLLADRRFRLAVAHAINRRELIDRALNGYGTEAVGPFLHESWASNPEVKPIPYAPEKAIELLKELGWEDSDGDGILEKEGEELELETLLHGTIDLRSKIAYLIRQQLQEIGIKFKIRKLTDIKSLGFNLNDKDDFETELRTIKSNAQPIICLFDWNSSYGNSSKIYNYFNSTLDDLISKMSIPLDKRQLTANLNKAHQTIYMDQPVNFLFFQHDFFVLKKGYNGTEEFFCSFTPFYKLKDWAQETSAR